MLPVVVVFLSPSNLYNVQRSMHYLIGSFLKGNMSSTNSGTSPKLGTLKTVPIIVSAHYFLRMALRSKKFVKTKPFCDIWINKTLLLVEKHLAVSVEELNSVLMNKNIVLITRTRLAFGRYLENVP